MTGLRHRVGCLCGASTAFSRARVSDVDAHLRGLGWALRGLFWTCPACTARRTR